MKGKIIKIDADKILIRPAENFLDVSVKSYLHNNFDKSLLGKEVEIRFDKIVNVIIDNISFCGTLNYEED